MNHYFPHLFEPIQIGSLTLRNRMTSSPTSQADVHHDGTLGKHNIAYYARKAKGGAAVVTVGDAIIDPSGQNHPVQQMIHTDSCMPTLVLCAEAIHQYGALASIEFSHGGICCDPAFLGGKLPIGPSEVPVHIGFQTVEMVETRSIAMTEEMMLALAKKYGEAAERAKRGGFDMCLVHGSHGWLLGQFLSPNVNLRTDQYGGSIENRCRFPIMVCKAIREAAGPKFAIEYRINGDDLIPDGLHIDEAVQACKLLEPHVDAFHVTAGVHYARPTGVITHPSMFLPRGIFVDYAAAVKKAVKVPVTTVAGHCNPKDMEEIIASGKADIIAMARQLISDPDMPKKAKRGLVNEVRRCIRCGLCQTSRFVLSTARCALNPTIGREYETELMPPAKRSLKVLIAGGGPSGMQAAITAAERGHQVTLYEKTGSLGGVLRFAKDVPFKCDLYNLIESMTAQLNSLNVRVLLGTELTPEIARAQHPDVLIAAIGAKPIVPLLPGIEKPHVKLMADINSETEIGERVVIIGGGLVGCEEALHLTIKQREPRHVVTVIEMTDRPYRDESNFRHIWGLEAEMEKNSLKPMLNTRCTKITDDGVEVIDSGGNPLFIPADTVIIAVGSYAPREQVLALRECAPEFRPIGDCAKVAQVTEAIRTGYDAAITIE